MVFLAKASISKEDGKTRGGMDFGSEYNRIRFSEWLKTHPGHELRISPVTPTRTIQQNKFYWLYLQKIEFETGNTADDLHEYFKRTLLPPKFIKVFGKEVKIPSSTTDLKKLEFGEYMDKISAQTNVEIPDAEAFKHWRDTSPSANETYPGDNKK